MNPVTEFYAVVRDETVLDSSEIVSLHLTRQAAARALAAKEKYYGGLFRIEYVHDVPEDLYQTEGLKGLNESR